MAWRMDPMMDMSFSMRLETETLLDRVTTMIREEIMPLEEDYQAEVGKGDRWQYTDRQTGILEGLKVRASAGGLWNFWLTDSAKGFGRRRAVFQPDQCRRRAHLATRGRSRRRSDPDPSPLT